MKRLLIILIIALVCATCVVPVFADSDDNSGNRSSDSGSDDIAGNGSDDSSDDSPGDLSMTTWMTVRTVSMTDRAQIHRPAMIRVPTIIVDDSPDDSGQETEPEHTDENELEDHILKQEIEVETELEREGIDDAVRNNQKVYLVGVDAFQYVTELDTTYNDNLTGIETELENSLAATTRAEMQIRSRDAVTRFFMGGDETAAHELEQHLDANEVRHQRTRTAHREMYDLQRTGQGAAQGYDPGDGSGTGQVTGVITSGVAGSGYPRLDLEVVRDTVFFIH